MWYEMHMNWLRFIALVEVFDQYLRAHVEHFKYRTITTDDWKEYFLSYFHKQVSRYFIRRILNISIGGGRFAG